MARLILIMMTVICCFNAAEAIENVSIGLGGNYLPKSEVENGEFGQYKETTYDNLFGEVSAFAGLPMNFRVGSYFSYYSKTVAPETIIDSDVSIWGIGMLADYGYEITESGSTFFVMGAESG